MSNLQKHQFACLLFLMRNFSPLKSRSVYYLYTTHTAVAVCRSMERIEGKVVVLLLASLYDVLIQINEFKVNSSDSNQLDEEHIGSVSTLTPMMTTNYRRVRDDVADVTVG